MGTNLIRAMLLASASATVAITATPTAAYAQEASYQIDIPSQSMGDALRALGKATKQNIVFNGSIVKGKRSAAVRGRMSAGDALAQMLAGSGLKMSRGSGGGLVVVQGGNGPAVAETSASLGEDGAEIVVTGTNIRGANATSPVLRYDRREIQDAGYATVQELVRDLPQNFGGGSAGASPDGALGSGPSAGKNPSGASTVNLRGLGEVATLVLLNGHRLAPTASGGLVDISTIPLIAIQQVDVVTDGASAIYGADAVAGVANFRLRRGSDGAETLFRAGLPTRGGFSDLLLAQSFGNKWESGDVFAAIQYERRSALSSTDRSFTSDVPQVTTILPRRRAFSGVLNAHQEAGDFEIFADALVAKVDTLNRINTGFEQLDLDSSNISNSFNAGLRYRGWQGWQIELSGNYGRTVEETDQTSSATGLSAFKVQSSIASAYIKADGSVVSLPGGAIKLALGGGYRKEHGSSVTNITKLSRDVQSAFAELYVPIFADDNALPLLRRLELSAAIRYDHYSDFGSTTNEKLGALWSPFDGLKLRASYGTSFRAPTFGETVLTGSGYFIVIRPFTAPNGVGTVPTLQLAGSGGVLSAEKAKTWTAGFDFAPTNVPGFSLSASYYAVDFRNRITTPPFDFGALTRQDIYGSLITPIPSAADAATFLAAARAQGAVVIDFLGLGENNARFVYNGQTQNAAISRQSGFDITARYDFSAGASNFSARGNVAIINHIRTAFAPGAAFVDTSNTYGNPLKFRARGDVTWSRKRIRLNIAANFNNRYDDTTAVPVSRISSWTTFDIAGGYHLGEGDRGPAVEVVINNLFDRNPPFVGGFANLTSGVHYDVGNADPRGRMIAISLRQSW